ncbi:MAG: histidinol-phosphate aminotransferase family protein [Thaumarchaeota archaeon]|nr:histidinol-phosphate aminotransferase family protein [Nitrososphaerota archaeon]
MSRLEKGGFPLGGINLALCENPLPPLEEAIEAAKEELHLCNHYTEPHSQRLLEKISEYVGVPTNNIHLNAGSEIILRQLFSLYGQKVHLISPTYYLFEEIAKDKSHTALEEKTNFQFDITKLMIPKETTLAVLVNPNNPTGGIFDIKNNLGLIENHPKTVFLIDEAFIEFGGESAASLIFDYDNVIITRTFSKAFSLAGLRTGYAIGNEDVIFILNKNNDAYPLGRTAEAAAMASLKNIKKIKERVALLKSLTKEFTNNLEKLGIITYPTETYFFLIKVPKFTADEFVRLLEEKNIHARALQQTGLENKFVRFATSTRENNRKVLDAIHEIMGRR